MKRIFLIITILFLSKQSFSQNCITDPSNRMEITENLRENNFIAHIIVHRNWGRKYNATVSFISPNVMIGAGHSFKERWFSKIKKIEIYIGQRNENGKNMYTSKHEFSRKDLKILINPTFKKKNNPDFDYAIVALNKKIVSDFFKLKNFDTIKSKLKKVTINGYPGDKGSKALWTKNTYIENITSKENVLLHNMFTYTGDSGAPIWCKLNNSYNLLGVHGTGNYKNGSCNAGIKLTTERINLIHKFIKNNKN